MTSKNLSSLALLLCVFTATAHAQFPLTAPDVADMRLGFTGSPADGFGITGYRNFVMDQPNTGHLVSGVIQNAPNPPVPPQNKLYADYYITGINNSPFTRPNGGIAAARATTPFNLAHLPAYIANNGLSYGDIHFNFGQTVSANIETSWNLGADTLDSDWTGTLASPLEQRIYTGTPGLVEASLSFAGTKIITFGYSNLYETINYGATQLTTDDSIQAYSDAVTPSMVLGLAGHDLGIAEAFMSDVQAGGGLVQLYFDTIQAATYTGFPELYAGNNYIHANYSFSGYIMIIPEPAHFSLVLAGAALGLIGVRRRRRLG